MNPLELLPPALRALSESEHEPVLPWEEALAAVEVFERSRWAVCAWCPDAAPGGGERIGRRCGEDWDAYVHRCAERARRGIYAAGGAAPCYRLQVAPPE